MTYTILQDPQVKQMILPGYDNDVNQMNNPILSQQDPSGVANDLYVQLTTGLYGSNQVKHYIHTVWIIRVWL